jgi:hypothetical protein
MAKSKRQRRAETAPSAASVVTRATGAASTTTGSASGASATKVAERPAAGASRLSEIRARTASATGASGTRASQRPQQNRRRYAPQQPWWRRNLLALGSVVGVVIIVVAFIFYSQQRNKVTAVGIGDAAPQSVLSALSGVSNTTAAAVGTGGIADGFEGTPPGTPLLTSKGLPEVVYVGAEYCPYCAAERWSTIIALDKFGSFKGLTLMRSTASDRFPNTATFSFKGATYTSKYLVFSATETQDRNQAQLDTPPTEAIQSFSTYDTAPYTNQPGGIPFISYGDQYVTTSGPYQPTMLANLSWQQIASQLNNPNSDVTKAIVGTANYQTAMICKLTNNQPASACSPSYIQQIEASLPTR